MGTKSTPGFSLIFKSHKAELVGPSPKEREWGVEISGGGGTRLGDGPPSSEVMSRAGPRKKPSFLELWIGEGLPQEAVAPPDSPRGESLDSLSGHHILHIIVLSEAYSNRQPVHFFQCIGLAPSQEGVVDWRTVLKYGPDEAAVEAV